MVARAGDIISLATPAARYSVGIEGVRIGGWALIISSSSTATIEHEHRASSDHHPRGKRFHHNRHVEARWLQPIEPRLHVETNLLIICTKSDDEVETTHHTEQVSGVSFSLADPRLRQTTLHTWRPPCVKPLRSPHMDSPANRTRVLPRLSVSDSVSVFW